MKTNTTKAMSMIPQEISGEHESAIRRRAYELYEQRGQSAGYDLQDWLEAESEIMADDREDVAA